ncbi:MAG: hypothetical protein AB7E13_07285, partial [Arcobacteraceae bacterium]
YIICIISNLVLSCNLVLSAISLRMRETINSSSILNTAQFWVKCHISRHFKGLLKVVNLLIGAVAVNPTFLFNQINFTQNCAVLHKVAVCGVCNE